MVMMTKMLEYIGGMSLNACCFIMAYETEIPEELMDEMN